MYLWSLSLALHVCSDMNTRYNGNLLNDEFACGILNGSVRSYDCGVQWLDGTKRCIRTHVEGCEREVASWLQDGDLYFSEPYSFLAKSNPP